MTQFTNIIPDYSRTVHHHLQLGRPYLGSVFLEDQRDAWVAAIEPRDGEQFREAVTASGRFHTDHCGYIYGS